MAWPPGGSAAAGGGGQRRGVRWSALSSQAKLSPDAASCRFGPAGARTARATRAARSCHRQAAEIREFLVFVHSGVGCLYLRPVVLPKKKVFTRMELDDVILHVI